MENLLLTLGSTIPQGLAAIVFLVDRFKQDKSTTLSSKHPLSLAILLVVGFGITIGTLVHMHDNPEVKTVEKIVTVEKFQPCPTTTQKNGPATARGGRDASAHSGNGDTTVLLPPQVSPSNSHP